MPSSLRGMETDWTPAISADELPEGKATRVSVDGVDVLLYLAGETLFAIGNRCSHQGAPLHKGVVKSAGSIQSVTCPVHGSVFQLSDGRVLRGPALEPVAAYEARINGDMVQVRPRPGLA